VLKVAEKVRPIGDSSHLEQFLMDLLTEVHAGEVLGFAVVVQRSNGILTTWQTSTGPGFADRFRIAGGLGYLATRMYSQIDQEDSDGVDDE
jgi:hypothetical protein